MLMASGAPSLRAADEAITTWNPLRLMAEKAGLRARIEEGARRLAAMPEARVVAQSHGRVGFHGRAAAPAWVVLDLGIVATPDEVVLLPARVSDPAPDDAVGGFPPDVKCLLSVSGAQGSFQTMQEWAEASGGAGVRLDLLRLRNSGALAGRFLRIEVSGGRLRGRSRFFSLGEVWVLKDGVNLALGAPVTSSASIDNPPRWTAANLTDGFIWCGGTTGTERSPKNGFHSRIESAPEAAPKWVEVVLNTPVSVEEVRLVPARPADFADVTGFGFPPEFQVLAWADDSPDEKPVVVFDTGGAGFANPGDATVCLPAHGVKTRRVRVVAGRLWRRTSDYIFALAEMQVMSAGRNAALGREVRFSAIVESASWTPGALVDGFGSQRELMEVPRWLDEMESRAALEAALLPARARLAMLEIAHQRLLWRGAQMLVLAALFGAAAAVVFILLHQRRARAELRARIARDLHDEIGSQLSHLALLAETGGSRAGEALREIASGARETQQAMRDLVWLLEPGSADPRDLHARLRGLCRQMLEPAIAEVTVECAGAPPARQLPLEWTRDVLLFVKEALGNCARHSRARRARVGMTWSPGFFEWSLHDDGVGFDEKSPAFQPGAGLRNLRQRAAFLKGAAVIESAPGAGACVRLRAPLPR